MASAFFREIHARKTGLADEPSLQKVYHLKSQAKIIVQEDPDGGVGGSIWDAALSLFNEIETLGQQGQFKGSKIIDLGSGIFPFLLFCLLFCCIDLFICRRNWDLRSCHSSVRSWPSPSD
ncbi:MAG: hypothetical protein Q8P67_12235 [archaeon]|nr:hypothetical protein [archaeon]